MLFCNEIPSSALFWFRKTRDSKKRSAAENFAICGMSAIVKRFHWNRFKFRNPKGYRLTTKFWKTFKRQKHCFAFRAFCLMQKWKKPTYFSTRFDERALERRKLSTTKKIRRFRNKVWNLNGSSLFKIHKESACRNAARNEFSKLRSITFLGAYCRASLTEWHSDGHIKLIFRAIIAANTKINKNDVCRLTKTDPPSERPKLEANWSVSVSNPNGGLQVAVLLQA